MGKKLAQIAIDTPLDPTTIFNTCQSPQFIELSQLKSPENITSFIDGMFSQLMESTKDVDKKEEDLTKVKELLNQYGSFVYNLTNKNTEAAETQLKGLYQSCINLRSETA